MYTYAKVDYRLIRSMLGTCTEASIYNEHILQKAKKEIEKANKLAGKVSKAMEKYKGSEQISAEKEVKELQGVIRAYQAIIGKITDLPGTTEELLTLAKDLEAEFQDLCKNSEARKCTVFMKDERGWPIVSSHMLLGNLKENLKIMVNNGDKSIAKYKTVVGESGALDIKSVDEFIKPSIDIARDKDGKPALLERPIHFPGMHGETISAISLSEELPAGAELSTTFRIRKDSSVFTVDNLRKLLDLGKNNGLGAWRGSGNHGAYVYKLEVLDNYKDASIPEGWN